jgi:hypothetical protein
MAGAFQGFAVKSNLSESTSDRQIITNLGGSPLGDDITLLYNNKRNKSSITVTSDNIALDNYIRFNETDISAVFSNKTKLTINNQIFYVRDSNGLNEFRLSTNSNLSDIAAPLVGVYTRSDAITLENISNFSKIRRSTDVNAVQTETLTGFLNQSASILGSESPTDLLETMEANLDFYKFRSTKSITKVTNFLSSNPNIIRGYVRIQDIDNLNSAGLTNNTPGVFIYNPGTGAGVRAFSSSDNPWSQNSPYLESSSNNINIGTLRSATWVEGTTYNARAFSLTLKNSSIAPTVTETTIVSKTNFTHKVPVIINNETYYLCLKKE